jgi:hypothetical protein
VTTEAALELADGVVTLQLPDGGELTPDPADGDLLWWIAPGSTGGFSLAVRGAATPPEMLLSMERSLVDRVDVRRDEIVQIAGTPVRELQYISERHVARSWTAVPAGRRENPEGVERRTVRRRFWLDAPVSAGYLVPDGESAAQTRYDDILESARFTPTRRPSR